MQIVTLKLSRIELNYLTSMILNAKNITTDWKDFIESELNKDYLKEIDNKLSQFHKTFYPPIDKVFNAFNFFNIEDTKVVIFGQDPYHGDKEANGLSFSVDSGIKIPPSLRNIFKKINSDFNINRTNTDLSDWAQQGMLLLNTTLTVYKDEPASHAKWSWINFTQAVIERLNQNKKPIVFILWGSHAQALEKYIDSSKHKIIKSCHPSPLSATRCGFFETTTFKEVDQFLKDNYKIQFKW